MIVIDGGGATERALWGDKMSKLALDRGVAGIVVDGAVRDVDGIGSARLPGLRRREDADSASARSPGEVGVPVTLRRRDCPARETSSYGDADGVVVVPRRCGTPYSIGCGQGAGVTGPSLPVLPTTVVGSYAQPDWLIDRARLGSRLPPRVRARELWRVEEPFLEQAQDDATLLAIRDMERAGMDIVTDGEMRRESYSNRFATALEGVDLDNPGVALDRTGHENPVPRVVGPIRRTRPVEVRDVEFLRANTDRPIKITLPGPFTMAQQAQDDHYRDEESLTLGYAEAVNEEARDLKAAGADVVQIDEPYLQARPEQARPTALEAIDRALEGIEGHDRAPHLLRLRPHRQGQAARLSFLEELNECAVDQISVETAQPNVDPAVLPTAPGQDDHPGSDRPLRRRTRRIAGAGRRADPPPRSSTCHRSGSWSPRTAG